MNDESIKIDGVSFSSMNPINSMNKENMVLHRSILSRAAALKGIRLTLSRLPNGKAFREEAYEIPNEAIQTEAIAPEFDVPQTVLEEVPTEDNKVAEVVSTFEVPTDDVQVNIGVPELEPVVYEEPVMAQDASSVEKEETSTLTEKKPILRIINHSRQRGIKAPIAMKKDFIAASLVIDSPKPTKEDSNFDYSSLVVPKLEPIPYYEELDFMKELEIAMNKPKEDFIPNDNSIIVGDDDVQIDLENYEEPAIEEPKESVNMSQEDNSIPNDVSLIDGEVHIDLENHEEPSLEEPKHITTSEVFSPIGPKNDDDLLTVLDGLDEVAKLEEDYLDENQRMRAELEALREKNGSLDASLRFEQDKVINFAESVKRLEAEKLEQENKHKEEQDRLKAELARKENSIIELSALADKATENERIANEYKNKYRLLYGKVYTFVKKSSSRVADVDVPEDTSEHIKAA